MHNDIFPDGKVKYFLRKYEILLTQYEICPQGILWYHFVMIKIKMLSCNLAAEHFFITFSKKIYHCVLGISLCPTR